MIWMSLRRRSKQLYSSTHVLLSVNQKNTIPFFPFPSSSPSPLPNPNFPPKTLTLTLSLNPVLSSFPYSTLPTRPHLQTRNPRKKKKTNRNPPPLDQSQIDDAISQLPPRFSPSDLADAIANQPNPLICCHLFTWATHQTRFRPDPDPFLITIKKLGSARLYQEMSSVASLALSLPCLPFPETLFNTIIYFYAEARMLSKAIYAYKIMRSSPDPASRPTTRTFNLLFAALIGRGSNSYIHHVYMDTVRCLFRQMVDSGVDPDIHTLNFVIRGYAHSLHLNDALRIFHQMGPVYGCEADEHTYSHLVHGLCSQGRTRNATELYREMRGKGMTPSGRACNSLVSALAMEGEAEAAVGVILEMDGMGRAADAITWRTVVEEICRQGRVGDAVGLLREMREKEMVDGRSYRELLNGIQDGYGGGG